MKNSNIMGISALGKLGTQLCITTVGPDNLHQTNKKTMTLLLIFGWMAKAQSLRANTYKNIDNIVDELLIITIISNFTKVILLLTFIITLIYSMNILIKYGMLFLAMFMEI